MSTPRAAAPWRAPASTIADDVAALAAAAPAIITSLPKPDALAEATAKAIVAARVRPLVIVEASTFTIADKLKAERTLRKAGHAMLDCPISGTGAQAKTKDLGLCQRRQQGESASSSRCSPLLPGRATTSARSATAAA